MANNINICRNYKISRIANNNKKKKWFFPVNKFVKSFNKKNYSKQINSNKHNCNKKHSEVIFNNNFMIKYLKMNNINKIIIM